MNLIKKTIVLIIYEEPHCLSELCVDEKVYVLSVLSETIKSISFTIGGNFTHHHKSIVLDVIAKLTEDRMDTYYTDYIINDIVKGLLDVVSESSGNFNERTNGVFVGANTIMSNDLTDIVLTMMLSKNNN